MGKKAFAVIDIQNDITKHYRDIINRLNAAIDWGLEQGMDVVYIRHNNLSPGARTFKPDTKGAEPVPELKIVSDNIFVKTKASALTSEAFSGYVRENGIDEFYITGADATACVKSTCFNMTKAGYIVHVITDCVTSYDPKKLPEMLAYYAAKGCEVRPLAEFICEKKDTAIDISMLSSRYTVRKLEESDADSILALCRQNTQFYEYCEAEPTREQVLNDLKITPPGIGLSDKYYIGFYEQDILIAVMDLIDGYPEPDVAYIGFFMMNKDLQGQGIGSAVIQEAAAYLKEKDKTAIQLAIDKENPQSSHFWKKNGFHVIRVVDRNGWIALAAEKRL